MKRYWVFSYIYYPMGGMDDFYDSFNTFEEALTTPTGGQFSDVFDSQTNSVWDNSNKKWVPVKSKRER